MQKKGLNLNVFFFIAEEWKVSKFSYFVHNLAVFYFHTDDIIILFVKAKTKWVLTYGRHSQIETFCNGYSPLTEMAIRTCNLVKFIHNKCWYISIYIFGFSFNPKKHEFQYRNLVDFYPELNYLWLKFEKFPRSVTGTQWPASSEWREK